MTPLDQLAHSMVNHCSEAMIAKTLEGTVVCWNAAAEALFGYEEREMLGHSIMTLVPLDRVAEEKNILDRLPSGETIRDFATLRMHKDGRALPVVLTISPIYDAAGNVIGASNIVRPQLSSAVHEELFKLAFRDSVTGLSNRAHLNDRLKQAMQRNERSRKHGGILFIDLDNFKAVNDDYGHQIGDTLLIKCARRLQQTVRECDTVARWGGDEFVVMVEELHQNRLQAFIYLEQIARKILFSLRRPYSIKGVTHQCSPSIGACLFRGVVDSIEDTISEADKAMYRAKQSGKNGLVIEGSRPRDTLDAVPNISQSA